MLPLGFEIRQALRMTCLAASQIITCSKYFQSHEAMHEHYKAVSDCCCDTKRTSKGWLSDGSVIGCGIFSCLEAQQTGQDDSCTWQRGRLFLRP